MQLEEANRTLTSDVANLANEKEELNNKLKEAVEGNSKLQDKIFLKAYLNLIIHCGLFFLFRIRKVKGLGTADQPDEADI